MSGKMFKDYSTSPIDVFDDEDNWVCTYRYEPFLKKWFYIKPDMHGELMIVDRDDLPKELYEYTETVEYEELYSYYAPIKIQIQLNRSCNFSCKMCYVPESDTNKLLSLQELDLLFEECKDIGVVRVNLVGGEIFVRKDIEKIVALAKKHCLLVSCITNAIIPGMNIERYSSLLKQFYMIQVSCNGFEDSYDFEHGRNIWDKASKCIANVIKENNANILSYVVTKENVDDIPKFVEFAEQLKPFIVKFGSVCWSGKSIDQGDEYYYRCVLPKAKKLIEECRLKHPLLRIQSQLDDSKEAPLWEEYSNGYRPFEFYFSPEGRDNLYLSASGDYYPFPLLSDRTEFNIGRIGDSLIDIWRNSEVLNNIRNVRFANSECGKINCVNVCGLWNRSYAIAWSGDMFGKVPCRKTNWN
jgi:MoaA/NifB/PqqE/SkfB family radical SAM enzyme